MRSGKKDSAIILEFESKYGNSNGKNQFDEQEKDAQAITHPSKVADDINHQKFDSPASQATTKASLHNRDLQNTPKYAASRKTKTVKVYINVNLPICKREYRTRLKKAIAKKAKSTDHKFIPRRSVRLTISLTPAFQRYISRYQMHVLRRKPKLKKFLYEDLINDSLD